ncbi:MAG: glutamate-5-semialdehyde dehydrogenase [Myxococcales bacterium]|nr:glutamate-5-semialdehyde dehydrogenase [Myxococcales bacterium]
MSDLSAAHRDEMDALGRRARAAARAVARAPGRQRTAALLGMADALDGATDAILAANAKDLARADDKGITGAMRDRLKLTADRVAGMASGLREIAALPDPIGEVLGERTRPNGIRVAQVRIPLGVIGIIYEARPNVTADAAGLCLKSGNAVFLRGGSEAAHSNQAILDVLREALTAAGLPADAVMALPSTDRAWIHAMLEAEDHLDVIIPRGGEALIRFVTAHSRVPVIKHYKGVCHVFVDRAADFDKAAAIAMNAKVQRPGVCNAMETLLVHVDAAPRFLPRVAAELQAAGVELRGCARTRALVPTAKAATEADWHAEFLDLILAVRVVDDLDGAIAHIEAYGSDHTEAIISEDYSAVRRFLTEVNSSVVVANASTRFSDGGQMGLGAEIGISTTRLHAYGPMGVNDLTTRKYVITGDGQTRQ